MSDQSSVSITSDHGNHRLVIDGENVGRDVTDVGVSISAGEYPKVDMTFARPHVDLDLTKADVEANVTTLQRRLLIAAGWSPPEKTEREPQYGAIDPGRLRAGIEALHRPVTTDALMGDHADELCECEDECPTEPVQVCRECARIAEESDPYYGERGLSATLWPCATADLLNPTQG